MRTAINFCAFIQFCRNILKERMQHPDGKGLINRNQNGDQ